MSGIDALPAMTVSRMAPALAALAHLPALALAAVLLASGLMTSGTAIAILVGMLAASTAWLWRLPVWWVAINLGFVPLAWLSLQAAIAPGWFLAGFVLLALTSPGAVRTRVPLFLSSPRAAEELARRLPERGRFIDLGCGLGGPLARLARTRPDAILAGVEAAPLNWLIARLRLMHRARIRLGSLWGTDLREADLVYAYLSPAPMDRLWKKARAEMRPGSLFVSNSFAVPGVPPHETIELSDLSGARLFVWRMP